MSKGVQRKPGGLPGPFKIATLDTLMGHDDIDIAELAALADGTLDAERAAEVRRRVEADPDLREALARQERVVTAMRATHEESAPAGLVGRVRGLEAEATPSRRGLWLVPAGAVATVVLALLGVFAIVGGGGNDLDALADIGDEPLKISAPALDASEPMLLDRSIDGVVFPSWEQEFDLAAIGGRDDEIDGRAVATVFYGPEEDPVAYSILEGESLDVPDDARRVTSNEIEVSVLADGSGVTWEREGHTCFLSGGGLSEDRLVELASWMGGGAVPF